MRRCSNRRGHRATSRSASRFRRIAPAAIEEMETRRLLANIVVNTLLDETDANATTSLREAIVLAAADGDDTITFDPAVFTGGTLHTITLAQGELSYSSIIGQLTIAGPGAEVLRVSGDGADRVFNFDIGTTVTISGMVISDGLTPSVGGGIRNEGTLSLNSVVVRHNAIHAPPGLDGDDVTPGETPGAVFGGGIYSTGALTIANSKIHDNAAIAGTGGSAPAGNGDGGEAFGGAIYAAGNLTITNTEFLENDARAGDGGTFPGVNGGNGGFAQGGGIYIADADAVGSIISSRFDHNTARGGEGGAADASHSGGNGGFASGGAIASDSSFFTVNSTDFVNNRTFGGFGGAAANPGAAGPAYGAAVDNEGELTVTSGLFENNINSGGDSDDDGGDAYGGAIYNGVQLAVTSVTFKNNRTIGGDGGAFGATGWGGAIANFGNTIATAVLFQDNGAFAGDGYLAGGIGGGAYGGAIYSSGTLSVTLSTLTGNLAEASVSAPGVAGATAGGGAFSGPVGGNALGGAILSFGELNITGSTLRSNSAFGGEGGDGFIVGGGGGLAAGGALYVAAATTITNSTLYDNRAIGGAGGAGAPSGGSGGMGRSGAIDVDNALLNLLNVTIAHNAAFGGAAGAGAAAGIGRAGAISGGDILNLTNTIVANNIAAQAPNLFGAFTLVNTLVSNDPSSGYSALAGSSGNLLGTPAELGALADNGGPTLTILPNPDSPAINAGNNAAALAEFGAGGFDQRGAGFPRFVGAVDIGAIETSVGPVISVFGNGNPIAHNDTTPSVVDFTDFGSQFRYAQPLLRTFFVQNTGSGTLTLSSPALPAGYTIIEPLNPTLAAGESNSFTVQLSTLIAGTFAGDVVIPSNDAAAPSFTFRISGVISPTFKVNFQPQIAFVPNGYVPDVGLTFADRGNGLSYGFNQSIATATRDRNVLSDQARDTLVHTQLYGARTWEIAVPNGAYQVRLVAGDPQYFDSVYRINVEGVLTVNGTPTSGNRFIEGTQTVIVSDGRLTITNASGAVNNKLAFIEITPTVAVPVRVNFQTPTSATPAGFLPDSGAIFANRGNGFSYGWNQSASSFTRDRNAILSADQQHDTLVHMQLYGLRTWEMAVPNGTYQVRLVAGDPSFFDSVYRINVEGVLTVNGTPTSGNRWITGIQNVTVSDGRLTVTNAAGSVNNKLSFIEVTPL